MITKAIMILGILSLWTVVSCRCDLPSEDQEDKDKIKETQQLQATKSIK